MIVSLVRRLCIGAGVALGIFSAVSTAEAAGRLDPARPIFAISAASKAGVKEVDAHKAPSSRYSSLIAKHAKANGVPVALAHAVVRIESNFNERARGGAGEIGLMQIKPATARMIGFTGTTKALYEPSTNLQWGMKYLAGAHQLAGGDTCGTILRYNAGHYAKRMNPISARYCHKVKAVLKQTTFEPENTRTFSILTGSDRR